MKFIKFLLITLVLASCSFESTLAITMSSKYPELPEGPYLNKTFGQGTSIVEEQCVSCTYTKTYKTGIMSLSCSCGHFDDSALIKYSRKNTHLDDADKCVESGNLIVNDNGTLICQSRADYNAQNIHWKASLSIMNKTDFDAQIYFYCENPRQWHAIKAGQSLRLEGEYNDGWSPFLATCKTPGGYAGWGQVIFKIPEADNVILDFLLNQGMDEGSYMTLDQANGNANVMVRGIRTNEVLSFPGKGLAYAVTNYDTPPIINNCRDIKKESISGGQAWGAFCTNNNGIEQARSYAYTSQCPDKTKLINCNGKLMCGGECLAPIAGCELLAKKDISGGTAWTGLCQNDEGQKVESYMYLQDCSDATKLFNCKGRLSCGRCGIANCNNFKLENISGGAAWSAQCKNNANEEQAISYVYLQNCPDGAKLRNCDGKLTCGACPSTPPATTSQSTPTYSTLTIKNNTTFNAQVRLNCVNETFTIPTTGSSGGNSLDIVRSFSNCNGSTGTVTFTIPGKPDAVLNFTINQDIANNSTMNLEPKNGQAQVVVKRINSDEVADEKATNWVSPEQITEELSTQAQIITTLQQTFNTARNNGNSLLDALGGDAAQKSNDLVRAHAAYNTAVTTAQQMNEPATAVQSLATKGTQDEQKNAIIAAATTAQAEMNALGNKLMTESNKFLSATKTAVQGLKDSIITAVTFSSPLTSSTIADADSAYNQASTKQEQMSTMINYMKPVAEFTGGANATYLEGNEGVYALAQQATNALKAARTIIDQARANQEQTSGGAGTDTTTKTGSTDTGKTSGNETSTADTGTGSTGTQPDKTPLPKTEEPKKTAAETALEKAKEQLQTEQEQEKIAEGKRKTAEQKQDEAAKAYEAAKTKVLDAKKEVVKQTKKLTEAKKAQRAALAANNQAKTDATQQVLTEAETAVGKAQEAYDAALEAGKKADPELMPARKALTDANQELALLKAAEKKEEADVKRADNRVKTLENATTKKK